MLSEVIEQLKDLQEDFTRFEGSTKEKVVELTKEVEGLKLDLKLSKDYNTFHADPKDVAYMMKHGLPEQQEWGNTLELELELN